MRDRHGDGLVGLAGWLFADLLFVLVLIFLVSGGALAAPAPRPTSAPSPPASPPTRTCTKSISDTPRTATYAPPGHATPTQAELVQALGDSAAEEEGLIQTQVTDVTIGRAYQDAQTVNALLAGTPGVTGATHFDTLGWQDPSGDAWRIQFTVYPFVTQCVSG